MVTSRVTFGASRRPWIRGERIASLAWLAPWLCSIGLVFALWHWGLRTRQVSHFGDDQEYLTMTMSFVRHGSPEFRPGDDLDMLRALPPRWQRTIARKFHTPHAPAAYFPGQDGAYYAFHFFTYSALSAPLRKWFDGQPQAARAHQFTNLLWLSLAMLSLLQLRASPRLYWTLTPLAFLTPVLWFSTYAHTECFVYACGIIALACFLRDRLLLAIWFNSLAATQYQPLALLSFGLGALWLGRHWTAWREPRVWPRFASLAAGCALVLFPSAFYYAHFGVPNLIVRDGMASAKFMSAAKFFWLFVDPNGGLLAYAPGLFVWLALATVWAVRRAVRERKFDGLLLGACAIGGLLGSTVQRNWNHPTFGISRYVLYGLAPMLLFIGHELRAFAGRRAAWLGCAGVALALQILIHRAYGFMEYSGKDSAHHSAFASFVLERWPALYSPPDEIFCERTVRKCMVDGVTGAAYAEYLPIVWRDATGRAHKILAQRCDAQRVLDAAAWSAEERDKIAAALRRCSGAGTFYIDL